ncbi:MAG: PRC-barrel domain-containing protein [Nanoarchaeota archaeon]|nr:PRC-barrel domain-containing protein [Nanoarchaeota archaeon]
MKKEYNFLLGMILVIGILLIAFVLAIPPTWQGSEVNYSVIEDTVYYHDLRENITGYNNDVTFAINTLQTNISWTNASGTFNVTESAVSGWISILSAITGNLSINATHNNQTGFFVIPIEAKNTTDDAATTVNFEFIINATNDFPNFTNIDTEYNLTQNINFADYLNASDEEEHYPLFFNISFFDNCSLANWSTRGEGNCSFFNADYFSNISALMNFTPSHNDVGIYWANLSVMDNGENYTCPHAYCDNTTYQQNKTIYYSRVVVFNVFSTLDVNISDCQNKVFQENESGTCIINITTKDQADSLNISSKGFLRNYDASVVNASWFYSTNQFTAENFSKTIVINYTPQKTEIGNWTINFSVQDLTSGESSVEQIYVYVNRTINDIPELANIENQNTSINLLTRINISAYDDDLLIPDKNNSFGGYNETSSFTAIILNQSNLSQELSLNGFDVEILNMPVSGTNRTEAKIEFTPNESESGNYTINISVSDVENTIDSLVFNLSILSNAAPVWNATIYYFDLIVNSSYINTSNFYLNLTDGYVIDSDLDDTLEFSNTSAMPSLNLTSAGIINFTPYKQDVGGWSFNITATDDLGLTNTSIFIFNISNTNTNPVIETPISAVNASVASNSNITCAEDNITTITLWIDDDDVKITNKTTYNETFIVNVTIQGNNSNLFEFVIDSSFPTTGSNKSRYEAVFTPNRTDAGIYNITINVTDASNASDVLVFNLTVESVNDFPVLEDISNQTSASNRSFYYDFNASDEEDGNDTQGNLIFSYDFISGTDFINNNQTIFNTTSGILNVTFNDTQGGIYSINLSVNDSENLIDSQLFSISVYSAPNINYPLLGDNFSLQENVTSNLNFTINHSMEDNLTYLFYINDILKNSSDYYGNNTNFTWQFAPNFTDETHGDFKNLTLVVYPSTSSLINKTDINTTMNWNINITHTNSPVSFSGYIGDRQASYDSSITVNLSSYFADVDYADAYINQTVNFSVESDSFPSYISASVSDWILTLSSSIAVTEILNITGNDSFSEATSNSFEVEFTTPTVTTVTTPSTGGGGGGSTTEVYVSLKIIVPEPASVYQKDRIVLPITLYNSGKKILSGITLSGSVEGDSSIINDVKLSFEETYVSSLGIGEKKVVNLIMDVNTDEVGAFEVTLNASVENPDYEDWGKIYFTIKEGGSGVLGKLLFVEEFLVDNPECAELTEIVKEARDFFDKGDFINTVLKINQAIDACKRAISQPNMMRERENLEEKFYRYLLIITIIVFFIGFTYYSYKRMKLKRGSFDKNIIKKQLNQEKIKLVFFMLSAGVIGLFFTGNMMMTGDVVSDDNSNGLFSAWFFVILIFIFLILFFYKKKSLWKKICVSIKKIYLMLKLKNHKNKLYKLIKNKINFCHKKSYHTINNLIGRKVYAASGDYVGKVQNVYLRKNKINSLKIKLKSRGGFKNKFKKLQVFFQKSKIKGICVNYKQVKDIGNIVIIEEKVLKFLKNKGEFAV